MNAMLSRHEERGLTPDEFERHFEEVPVDNEG
jgi:hypothetical protein